MEFNKSVSNPMLMGAIELMKAEDTPEHRNMFFMAFTDMAEYEKWQEKNPEQRLPYFALKIEDYAGIVLRKDAKGNICPALGIVVNPFGANIVVPREMLAGMMSAKAAQAKQAIARQAAENKVAQFKPSK